MDKLEYMVFGKNMETISLKYGIFLFLWGLIVTFISGSSSITSLIPSFLGILLFVFSYLAIKLSDKKKLFMHIVVALGFLIFLGGFRVISNIDSLFTDKLWADVSQIMMVITGGFFSYHCIQSFIFVRRKK